jgi:hypothetical protein
MDSGYGHLRTRELTISARGRGAAARPITASLVVTSSGALTLAGATVSALRAEH